MDVVNLFLCHPNIVDKDGGAFKSAISNNKVEAAQALYHKMREKKIEYFMQNSLIDALRIGCSKGAVEAVKWMLELPNIGNINEPNEKDNNMAPILDASKSGNIDVVKLLLKQKDIDPKVKTSDGLTIVQIAKQTGDEVFHNKVKQVLEEWNKGQK